MACWHFGTSSDSIFFAVSINLFASFQNLMHFRTSISERNSTISGDPEVPDWQYSGRELESMALLHMVISGALTGWDVQLREQVLTVVFDGMRPSR